MTVKEYNICVDQHADGLYRFMLKQVGDVEQAKDLVQEAFAKMWVKRDEVNGEKAKSYLFSTAYHTMIDAMRRGKKQGPYSELEAEKRGHSSQYSDLNEVLHQALGTLPEIQKSVVLLRDYEGYSYAEIGDICTLSEAQVKVYIFRARQALRTYIGSMEMVI